MFKDLTPEQQTILNSEQQKIINSSELHIMVSASPGCGKTYTLVEKINKDMSIKSKKRGIIACSFTREASKQLENKLLSRNVELSLSFVGTIDAFVLTEIINPYKNRCLKYLFNTDTLIDKLVVIMPNMKSKANEITKTGKEHPEMKSYYEQWIQNFLNGEYEISYCSYLLAIKMIKEMPEVKLYISSRFTGIYIDEAQDLNGFQHELLIALKEECGLNTVLIGDKNQSIYEFRGARPALFADLINKGYVNYPISISVRCHKSIMDFSNLFIDDKLSVIGNIEKHVYIHNSYTESTLKKIIDSSENILWLCDSNELAQQLLKFSNENSYGFKYTKSLELSDANFVGTYFSLLEELLKFYYNYKNPIPSFSYSIENIETVFSDYITGSTFKKIKMIVMDVDLSPKNYIDKVFKEISVNIPMTLLSEIDTQLGMTIYSQHYTKTENKKRIMTIHSAKGLEASKVIVFIDYEDWIYNNHPEGRETKFRAYYVGFSRAEEELNIFYRVHKLDKGKRRISINQNAIKAKILASYNRL